MDYPEKELVMKSKNGDIESFEKLIILYEKRIYNIALNIIGNREDASDIAQEVCIKIYRSINKFMEKSSFSTWVYRITTNICIDEIRKKKYNTVPLIIEVDDEEMELPVRDKDKLPEEVVEGKEITEVINICINELALDYRIMIILRDIYGYTYEEISSILNVNIGTVKSRLNRARNLLKDKLKSKEPFISENV